MGGLMLYSKQSVPVVSIETKVMKHCCPHRVCKHHAPLSLPVGRYLQLLYMVLHGWSGHIKMRNNYPPIHSASLSVVSL